MPKRKAGDLVPVGQRSWYTPQEAAAQLGLSVVQLNRHARDGKIASIILPLSGNRVFDKTAVAQMREQELGAPSAEPGPVWPASVGLPPGAQVTTVLEVSRR